MQKQSGSSEEKEDETSSVSAICCGSPSRQVDSRDVETDPGGLWSTQEGQKSCLGFTGSKSSSYAVEKTVEVFPSVISSRVQKRTSQELL
jgi:hypothetical protein